VTTRTALGDLAGFVARSPLASPDESTRNRALDALVTRLVPRTQKRTVGDLLATVMALSARTRRLVQPTARVEVEVFMPGGQRAVELSFGD